MKATILFLTTIITLVLTGCAETYRYTQPQIPLKLSNSIIIEKDKAEVWEKIIPILKENFFPIKKLDENSGIISIQYNGEPEQYIDCGRIYSFFKQNECCQRTYNFPAAKAYQRYETMIKGQYAAIEQKMDLDGKVDIIIERISQSNTRITVNTLYTLEKTHTIYAGRPNRQTLCEAISFNSGKKAIFPSGQTTCLPNGKLEERILQLLNKV